MNNGQMWMTWNAINATDRVIGLQGLAGTGKTTVLKPIRDFAESYGYAARGLASTSGAVNEMRRIGIEARTLQSFLARKEEPIGKPIAYFVDESSLVDTRQLHSFLASIDSADRVFLVGDRRQHSSIGAGQIYAQLQDSGMTTYRLDKIVRQQRDDMKAIVKEFGIGSVPKGLQMLDDIGRIHEMASREKRYEYIATWYTQSNLKTLVASPDNQSRQDIGAEIREKLREFGGISQDIYRARVLNARQDLTTADKEFAPAYRPGDVIRYSFHANVLGVRNGDYASVVALNPDRNTITVMREKDGGIVEYNPRKVGRDVQVYEAVDRGFALGDRVQFTSQWKKKGIGNRELGTIEKLDREGNITVRTDKGKSVSWNLEAMAHLDWGYCLTSYSAQGATVERVLLNIETDAPNLRGLINRTLAYVGLSRGSLDMRVFTDNAAALDKALGREDTKPRALDHDQTVRYRRETPDRSQATMGMSR
jgi:ATP-dependent exoDNAse (exonuclease V) alpha subunit